jgi:hypothetical protein
VTGFGDESQVGADVTLPSSPRDGKQGWEQAGGNRDCSRHIVAWCPLGLVSGRCGSLGVY